MTVMDRDFAKAMMRHFDAIDLLSANMCELIDAHGPEDKKIAMKKAVYKCIGDLSLDVREEIVRAFPEFDRDTK